jgi:flagellar hook-basal body complex protein FliE
MIDSISSQIMPQSLLRPSGLDGLERVAGGLPAGLGSADSASGVKKPTSFADLVTNLVGEVDAKGKAAEGEVRRLMLGETDNIHQSMIAMQESGLAFSLLVEVRNKLVDSYQELMRMAV